LCSRRSTAHRATPVRFRDGPQTPRPAAIESDAGAGVEPLILDGAFGCCRHVNEAAASCQPFKSLIVSTLGAERLAPLHDLLVWLADAIADTWSPGDVRELRNPPAARIGLAVRQSGV
jgi:hypothetical protein